MRTRPILLVLFTSSLSLVGACGGGELSASVVAEGAAGGFREPRDAVPTGDGKTIYFVATTADGKPAVFQVPAGGGAVTTVVAGAPLKSPRGIAISTDDKTLYLADPGAGLLAVPIGGAPHALVLASFGPSGVEVVSEGGKDQIWFTGVSSGVPGVFKIGGAGGGLVVVVQRNPFSSPGGIAVSAGGDAFIANLTTVAAQAGTGTVVQVRGGAGTVLVDNLALGFPAGITLTADEKTLLVSALVAGKAALFVVDIAAKTVRTDSAGIGDNTAAGGIHRARNAPGVYAWAGATAIYRISAD